MVRRSVYGLFLCLAAQVAVSLRVEALEPEQVFEKASPSVVTVEALNAAGNVVGFGSGVVIAPGEVITNCHVVEDGVKWLVKQGGHSWHDE
jgi:serine protease Do